MNPVVNGKKKYESQLITTASPEICVVMLYERLVDDLECAESIFENSDFKPAFESLVHAQQIIRLLRSSIDTGIWSGGANLISLYNWFETRLSQAAMFQDRLALREVIPLVRELSTAWKQASDLVGSARESDGPREYAFAQTRSQIADYLA